MPLTLTHPLDPRSQPRSAALPSARWGGISGLAVAFGPLVGGAIVQGIAWQWIFWLNVPIGVAAHPARPARGCQESYGAGEAGPTCPALVLVSARPVRDRVGPRPR